MDTKEKPVDQEILRNYLENHINKIMRIRYRSLKKGSENHWRSIKLLKYDDVYFKALSDYDYPLTFRLDRVVEIEW